MKIVICIKQVPASTDVKIDDTTGTMIRSGMASKINPLDLYAIETALSLKGDGDHVVALTMGPISARSILEEALWMGVDEGVLLTDKAFAGSDVFATAYALQQAVNAIGDVDLILCGKQTIDGDTAQVGPELAEHLSVPHAVNVENVKMMSEEGVEVLSVMDDKVEHIRLKFPCVLTIDKGENTPRLPSLCLKRTIRKDQVRILTLANLDDRDINHYGLIGSPTRVVNMFTPTYEKTHRMLTGTPEELGEEIARTIADWKVI